MVKLPDEVQIGFILKRQQNRKVVAFLAISQQYWPLDIVYDLKGGSLADDLPFLAMQMTPSDERIWRRYD